MGGFEFLFDVFAVGGWWWVGWEVELAEGSVGGVRAETTP